MIQKKRQFYSHFKAELYQCFILQCFSKSIILPFQKMKVICKLILLLVCCGLFTKVTARYSVLGCIKTCAFCVENFGKDLYNGAECRDLCIITKGGSIDFTCTNDMFHTVKKKSVGSKDYNDSVSASLRRMGLFPSSWRSQLKYYK